MKILILGHGGHGKTLFAKLLKLKFGYKFSDSSLFCAENVVFPKLKEKYGYETFVDCFNERTWHREEWKKIISEFNTPDKTKLSKMILEKNEVYVGMRCREEFFASKHLFDKIFYVINYDKPEDPTMDIDLSTGMIWIDNSGSIENLIDRVECMVL